MKLDSLVLRVTVALLLTVVLRTSAETLSATSESRTFDVASVRLNVSGAERDRTEISNDAKTYSLLLENVSLSLCIQRAYGIRAFQIAGPSWLRSVHIDVRATGPRTPTDSDAVVWEMMRSLLKDRFDLQVSHERESRAVYALRALGSKTKLSEVHGIGPSNISGHGNEMTFTREPIASLASYLDRILDRPVIDRSGLTGDYSFSLKFSRDAIRSGPFALDPSSDTSEDAPDIFTALKEQLGLVASPEKSTVDIVAIKKINKEPTPN